MNETRKGGRELKNISLSMEDSLKDYLFSLLYYYDVEDYTEDFREEAIKACSQAGFNGEWAIESMVILMNKSGWTKEKILSACEWAKPYLQALRQEEERERG